MIQYLIIKPVFVLQPSAQATMELDPALVTIVSLVLIVFTLLILCCLVCLLRRKRIDKHNACATQRYRPANMQHTNGSAQEKQVGTYWA